MAEDPSTEDQPITFHIKTAGDAKFSVTVPLTMTVQSLKELLSSDNYAKIGPERQRLIYSGRVLKDPDTLASYKIKENNTIHLVKAAESNVRNQPGNQGASTASGSAGGAAAGTSQLPTMATGTGANNLLAGLTGARFAGHAQLPNQSMFGPDGGMGPLPDEEEQIRQLENPEFRRQLNEALDNPAVLDEMIRHNPMLSNMPNARQVLQNPMFRQMLTDPQVLRQQRQMMRAMGGGGQGNFAAPGGVESGEAQEGTTSPPPNAFGMFGQPGTGSMFDQNTMMQQMAQNMQNPEFRRQMQQMMQAMFAPAGGEATGNTEGQDRTGGDTATGQTDQSDAAANPFAALLGGAGGAGGANPFAGGANPFAGGANPFAGGANPFAGGANPFAGGANPYAGLQAALGGLPAGPPDNRPPEERYADQLRQLNDMGFYEFERNIEALRRSGGSVQGAVNHLLGG